MSTAAQFVPPLIDGQRLTNAEFIRRWEAMPNLKNAELIEGVVHLITIVSASHGGHDVLLTTWLGLYAFSTPGCSTFSNTSWVLEEGNIPQPDIALGLLPEYGGRWLLVDDVPTGVPDLAVEVTASSTSRDLREKVDLYGRKGVREYLAFVVKRKRRIEWRVLEDGSYRILEPDPDGVYRSLAFPGLWLDSDALLAEDGQRLVATLQKGLASPEHAAFVQSLAERRKS